MIAQQYTPEQNALILSGMKKCHEEYGVIRCAVCSRVDRNENKSCEYCKAIEISSRLSGGNYDS